MVRPLSVSCLSRGLYVAARRDGAVRRSAEPQVGAPGEGLVSAYPRGNAGDAAAKRPDRTIGACRPSRPTARTARSSAGCSSTAERSPRVPTSPPTRRSPDGPGRRHAAQRARRSAGPPREPGVRRTGARRERARCECSPREHVRGKRDRRHRLGHARRGASPPERFRRGRFRQGCAVPEGLDGGRSAARAGPADHPAHAAAPRHGAEELVETVVKRGYRLACEPVRKQPPRERPQSAPRSTSSRPAAARTPAASPPRVSTPRRDPA